MLCCSCFICLNKDSPVGE